MASVDYEAVARCFIDTWNTQKVDKVLARYTEDVEYRDPNTRGEIVGVAALRPYLTKLFDRWNMKWSLRHVLPFAEVSGCAVLWHVNFTRSGDGRMGGTDGMDLVLLSGELVRRNEVYFDRTPFTALEDGAPK